MAAAVNPAGPQPSHLLGLLGLLLAVSYIPGVRSALLRRRRPEQTLYEGGGGRLQGRRSSMVGAGRQRGRPVDLPDGLVVGGRSSVQPRGLLLLPGQGVLGLQHADAWVDAGGRSLQTGQGRAHSELSRRSDERYGEKNNFSLGIGSTISTDLFSPDLKLNY